MAKIRDTVFPLADYPSGAHNFSYNNVADDVTRLSLEIARCTTADPTIWPNASTTIAVMLEVSFDNGQTWQTACGFTAKGGIRVRWDGSDAPISRVNSPLPPGTGRRLRGSVTIAGGPLRSFGTLEVE